MRCGVSDETRLRFTTNERADLIDASRTETPFDASVPEIFDTKGGDDVLIAGPLADEVRAGAGRDSITGGPGADSLDGGPDDDVFVGLSEGDVVTGGDGADVLDLTGETQGMTISLNNIGDDGPLGSSANVLGIETVMGTLTDDILSGGDGADTLDGRDGNDRIDARGGGADTVDLRAGGGRRRDRRRDRLGDRLRAGRAAAAPGADADPVTPPAIAVVDVDGDGVVAGVDCDDTRAAIRPGARDVPGNKIDEDCAGGDARASQVGGRLSFDFTAFPNGTTRVDRLVVRELQAGGRAELRCSGRCAFRKKVGKAAGGQGQPPQADPRPPAHRRDARGPAVGARDDRPRGPLQDAQGASCPSARACACRPAGRWGAVPD